jgi:hypothetical protein
VRYDEEKKRVVYEPLQLTQAFRYAPPNSFSSLSLVPTLRCRHVAISSPPHLGNRSVVALIRHQRRSRFRRQKHQNLSRRNRCRCFRTDLVRELFLYFQEPLDYNYDGSLQFAYRLCESCYFTASMIVAPLFVTSTTFGRLPTLYRISALPLQLEVRP